MIATLCTIDLSRNCWYDVLHLSEKGSAKTVRLGMSFCSADARAHLIAFCMSSDVCSGCACDVPSHLHASYEYASCVAPKALSSGNGQSCHTIAIAMRRCGLCICGCVQKFMIQ